MSSEGFGSCPLCLEQMDLTDKQMKPCDCGYEICVWCLNKIIQTAENDDREGLCPACRNPYDKKKILGRTISPERLAVLSSEKISTLQKPKPKIEERSSHIKQQKDIDNMRVIRRNLVYVSGVPLKLADEKILRRKEFFGQYGKVVRIVIVQDIDACKRFPNSRIIYVTFSKEEEACRCISVVNGYSLDGYPLRACFGTTRFCHAWLSYMNCRNPDCLYYHGDCPDEDILPKNEAPGACLRLQQMSGISSANGSWRRSGTTLPPPITGSSTRTHVVQGHNGNWLNDGQTVDHCRTDILAGQSIDHDHSDSWRNEPQTSSDNKIDSLLVRQSRCTNDTNERSSAASVAVSLAHVPLANSATLLSSSSRNENRLQNPAPSNLVRGTNGVVKSSLTSDQYFGSVSIKNADVLTRKTEKHNCTESKLYGENVDGFAKRTIKPPGFMMKMTQPAASTAFRVLHNSNDKGSRCPSNTLGGISSAGRQPDSFFSSDTFLSNQQNVSNFTIPRSTSSLVFPSSNDRMSKQSCLTLTKSSNIGELSEAVSFLGSKLSEDIPATSTGYTAFYGSRPCNYETYAATCNEFSHKYEQQKICNESSRHEETKQKWMENQFLRTVEADKNIQQGGIIDFDIAGFSRQNQNIDIAEQEYDNQISDKDPLIHSMISHIFSVDDDEMNDKKDHRLGKLLDDTDTYKISKEYKPWMLHNGGPRFSFTSENYCRYPADKPLPLDSDASNLLKNYCQIDTMENVPVHSSSNHSGLSSSVLKGCDNLTASEVGSVASEPVSSFNPCRSGVSNPSTAEKCCFQRNDPRLCHGIQNQTTKFSQFKDGSHSSFPDILHSLIPGSNFGSMRTFGGNYEPKTS